MEQSISLRSKVASILTISMKLSVLSLEEKGKPSNDAHWRKHSGVSAVLMLILKMSGKNPPFTRNSWPRHQKSHYFGYLGSTDD